MNSVFSKNVKKVKLQIYGKKEEYTIPEHIFINEDNYEGNNNANRNDNSNNIADRTEIIRESGKYGLYTLPKNIRHFPGAYSVVIPYEDNATLNPDSSPKRVVLKTMKSTNDTYQKIKQEVDIYNKIRRQPGYSEHICRCYGVNQIRYNGLTHNYLTLEYMTCDLFDYIFKHKKKYNVYNAYSFVHQIALAFKFLHDYAIIYNDLKLENIMISKVRYNIETNRKTFKIKIIDFNCSTLMNNRKSAGGTLEYMSPELQDAIQIHNIRKLTTQSDIWGLGIMTCLLFFHSQPYESSDSKKVIQKIQINKMNLRTFCQQYIEYQKVHSHIPEYLDVNGSDLYTILNILDKCFKTKPKERGTIDDIISLVDKE